MSDEQQRKEVFAWFGAASYYAQCLEVELWIARLLLVREHEPWPEEREWQRLESERLTMGKLLRLVERGIGLDCAEQETLQTCLEKRNWLSHAYWEQRSHLLVSSEGCSQAADELADLCKMFKRGDGVACRLSAQIRARLGISEKLHRELQDEYLQRLHGGESHVTILQDQRERMKRLSARIDGAGEQNREHEQNEKLEG